MEIALIIAAAFAGTAVVKLLVVHKIEQIQQQRRLNKHARILAEHQHLSQDWRYNSRSRSSPRFDFRFCINTDCGVLIEKIGGCDHILCICGASFSWKDAKQCVCYQEEEQHKNRQQTRTTTNRLTRSSRFKFRSELAKWITVCVYDTNKGLGDECKICLDEPVKWRLKCGHELCQQCLLNILKTSKKCPFDESPQIDSPPQLVAPPPQFLKI